MLQNFLGMKITLIALFLSVFGFSAFSQNWLTDLDSAQALASAEQKNVILVFQGSDWCAPCIRMDRDLWHTDTFIQYATDSLIMVKCDFPRKKENKPSKEQQEKNDILAEKYNMAGYFPFVVIFDPNGSILDSHGFMDDGPDVYIERLRTFNN
jgi:thioredoxin-related protein